VDLWLSPHDARVRTLKETGDLVFGFAETPFGGCAILIADQHVLALYFAANKDAGASLLQTKWPGFALRQTPEADAMIPILFENPESMLLMAMGTPFQLTVWEYLRGIPKGTIVTYGEVARGIGRPTAARAVGRAVGANEISVLIPCHRVVSKGKLTGYRWGLDRKRNLLAWELANRDPLEMPF
jgi:AraC family transcriptional regulator of adaptative response/methylated-DNA-[protein]-cysteine methyltransferase